MQIRSDGLGLFFSLTTPLSFTIAGAMKRRRGRVECKRQRNEPQTAVKKDKTASRSSETDSLAEKAPRNTFSSRRKRISIHKKTAVDEISDRTSSRKRLERQK